jgi:hypothetical protein
MKNPPQNSRAILILLLVVLAMGFAIRLTDLDDPPLDFNPTRQLRSAIIARGLYYGGDDEVDPEKRAQAITHLQAMERLEPRILESTVSFTYRFMNGENLWVSRIFTTIFWLIGAGALYDLGRRLGSPLAALVGLGYFLFLPFSIRASRSFQPDPGMVMLILLTAWALYRWSQAPTWKWVLIAGTLGGLAALVKVVGIFFVSGMVLGLALHLKRVALPSSCDGKNRSLRTLVLAIRDPQLWVLAFLMVAPALFYYFLGIGEESTGYLTHWTFISRWGDLLSPSFYIRWMMRLDEILMLGLVLAGFAGSLVAEPKDQALLWGFWGGYFLYGLTFPYHILTHDYYHLPLVGLVALSLVPLVDLILQKIKLRGVVVRAIFTGLVAVFFFYNGWIGRSILLGQDFRDHPTFWREVGETFPADAKAVGLTQDYGFRLMYYGWRKIAIWPPGEGRGNFEENTAGAAYFVITAKNQLTPDMASYLEDHFPIHAEGAGYMVYDLIAQK